MRSSGSPPPPDDLGHPRRGHLGHRRAGRLRPLAPAGHPCRQRAPRRGERRPRRCRRAGGRPTCARCIAWRRCAPTSSAHGPRAALGPAVAGRRPSRGRRTAGHERRPAIARRSRSPRSTSAAGDAFQIVLSQRFDFDLGCDPFDVYRVLRQVNPSPYMFFLRQGGVSVVGASPEPMVQLLDGRVVSRPDRRDAAGAGSNDRRGPPARGGAGREPEGARRARHARRPGPQRRGKGGALRHRAGRTSS